MAMYQSFFLTFVHKYYSQFHSRASWAYTHFHHLLELIFSYISHQSLNLYPSHAPTFNLYPSQASRSNLYPSQTPRSNLYPPSPAPRFNLCEDQDPTSILNPSHAQKFNLDEDQDPRFNLYPSQDAPFLIPHRLFHWRIFVHTLSKIMAHWSSYLAICCLLNGLLFLNPKLRRKRDELLAVVSAPVEQLFIHHSWDTIGTKSIIRLLCPDRSSFVLLSYLVDVLSDLIHHQVSDLDHDPQQGHVLKQEFKESGQQDNVKLLKQMGVAEEYVDPMPSKVNRAVVESVRNGSGELMLPRSKWSAPICSITLEPLLDERGKITEDVVALVQGETVTGKHHAFLYRGHAFYNWLKTLQVPLSPDSRCVIRPMDIYRLS